MTTCFATALGLPTCPVQVRSIEELRVFSIERYDRHVDAEGRVHRLHQEDLCQALGLRPTPKYESEGGPSFDTCYLCVQAQSQEPLPDARVLLDWLIFCALAGNADGHAKNLSLVRQRDGGWRLSSFYDLACTGAYPRLSRNLAMRGPHGRPRLHSRAGLGRPRGSCESLAPLREGPRCQLARPRFDVAVSYFEEPTWYNGMAVMEDGLLLMSRSLTGSIITGGRLAVLMVTASRCCTPWKGRRG